MKELLPNEKHVYFRIRIMWHDRVGMPCAVNSFFNCSLKIVLPLFLNMDFIFISIYFLIYESIKLNLNIHFTLIFTYMH